METALILLFLLSSFLFGGVLIWSGLTMSQYVKSGNSGLVGFTMFWVFNSDWFTPEGQETYRIERKRVLLFFGITIAAFIGLAILRWTRW